MNSLETLFLAKDVRFFKELESTNSKLKQLLSEQTLAEGVLVYASYQTGGRGQRNSSWFSPPGENILMSLLLKPNFLEADMQFELNKIISLSIISLLEDLGLKEDIHIKWPNDVYVAGKKLSGILIECGLSGSKISEAVVGIGLNVNSESFPEDLSNACSLVTLLKNGEKLSVEELMFKLVKNIEQYYLLLRAKKNKGLHQQYLSYLLGYREVREFELYEEQIERGHIQGVDPQGRLIVKFGQRTMLFNNKEIKFIL